MMLELVCMGCASPFTPVRRDQQHCSVRCRQRVKRDRERQKRDSLQRPQTRELLSVPDGALVEQQEESTLMDVPIEQQKLAMAGAALAQEFVLAHGGYLDLPLVLQAVADDENDRFLFLLARPCGFDGYINMVYLPDATGQPVCTPLPMARVEVFTFVKSVLYLRDHRLAVLAPLAWRVGYAVGWLTGLHLHQLDEAQAGLVGLTMLVNPLLLRIVKTPRLNGEFVRMSGCQKVRDIHEA